MSEALGIVILISLGIIVAEIINISYYLKEILKILKDDKNRNN